MVSGCLDLTISRVAGPNIWKYSDFLPGCSVLVAERCSGGGDGRKWTTKREHPSVVPVGAHLVKSPYWFLCAMSRPAVMDISVISIGGGGRIPIPALATTGLVTGPDLI